MSITLAIGIPVYNNVIQFKECLKSLEIQSNLNFNVYIYDDFSSDDYTFFTKEKYKFTIKYTLNVKNIGALANMQLAYNSLKDKYNFVMIMHEDDLLHYQFIENVYKALLENKNLAFLMSTFISFDKTNDLKKYTDLNYHTTNTLLINKRELSLLFLQQKALAFGSVIYNTNIYKFMQLNLKEYEEFADRPFLLENLNYFSKVALFNEPLYYYRSHGLTDNRWKYLLPINVFNLLNYYKNIIVKSNFISNKVFKKYATSFIIESYTNLSLTGKNQSYTFYLIGALKHNFISIKYALLKISIINKISTNLKKLIN